MLKKLCQSLFCTILPLSAQAIPREKIFEQPACLSVKLSPDGQRLAYVGADNEGTMNLYIADGLSLNGARQITDFKEPKLKTFHWLDNQKIIFLKDKDGTDQFRLYLADVDSFQTRELTKDFGAIIAKIISVSGNRAVVGINDRNPVFHDLYLLENNVDVHLPPSSGGEKREG